MTRTEQIKKCPKCGSTYEENTYMGNPTKGARTKYGSPIKQCQICKNIFIDDEYREIEVQGIHWVHKLIVSPLTAMYSSILVIVGVMNCLDEISVGGVLFGMIGLVWFLSEALGYKKRQEILREEAEASRIRLLNPSYALALKKCGYDVPNTYLPKDIYE